MGEEQAPRDARPRPAPERRRPSRRRGRPGGAEGLGLRTPRREARPVALAGRQATPGELPDWLKDSPKAGPASEDAKARARERMLKLIEEGKKPLEKAPPAEDAEGPGKGGEARAPDEP